jgi:hypothetical protein
MATLACDDPPDGFSAAQLFAQGARRFAFGAAVPLPPRCSR